MSHLYEILEEAESETEEDQWLPGLEVGVRFDCKGAGGNFGGGGGMLQILFVAVITGLSLITNIHQTVLLIKPSKAGKTSNKRRVWLQREMNWGH